MKDKLNQRSSKFSLVFNDNGADLFKNSRYIVTTIRNCGLLSIHFIACIKHDKDLDEQTNQLKTIHYHIVLSLYNTTRLITMIKLLVDLFHCNENQISIEKCTSLEMATRYLIHLDDFDKADYRKEDIETNDYSFFTLSFSCTCLTYNLINFLTM